MLLLGVGREETGTRGHRWAAMVRAEHVSRACDDAASGVVHVSDEPLMAGCLNRGRCGFRSRCDQSCGLVVLYKKKGICTRIAFDPLRRGITLQEMIVLKLPHDGVYLTTAIHEREMNLWDVPV